MLSLFTRCCLPEGGLFRCSLVARRTFLLFLWRHKSGGARGGGGFERVALPNQLLHRAALDGLYGLNGLFVGSRGGHHLSKPISNWTQLLLLLLLLWYSPWFLVPLWWWWWCWLSRPQRPRRLWAAAVCCSEAIASSKQLEDEDESDHLSLCLKGPTADTGFLPRSWRTIFQPP